MLGCNYAILYNERASDKILGLVLLRYARYTSIEIYLFPEGRLSRTFSFKFPYFC